FVDQYAVESSLDELLHDAIEQLGVISEAVRPSLQTNARSYDSRTCPLVECRSPQHRLHAALTIVEIGLQQCRRFPRVHRRIIEIYFPHQGTLASLVHT